MQTKCLAKVPLRDSQDLQMEVDWRWGARCFYTFGISSVHSLVFATLMGRGDDTQLFAGSSSERSPISSRYPGQQYLTKFYSTQRTYRRLISRKALQGQDYRRICVIQIQLLFCFFEPFVIGNRKSCRKYETVIWGLSLILRSFSKSLN